MAKIRSTAIRNFFATVFAIILIVLFASAVCAVMDWNVPVLTDIGNRMGL